MLKLQSLNTAHIPLLREYFSLYSHEACDYSICNLMTWGRIYDNQFALWREHLVIFIPRFQYVLFPVGKGLVPEELTELLSLFHLDFKDAGLILIPEEYLSANPEMELFFEIREDRAWADYIYSTEKMVSLSGKKLAKKKNLVSQFIRAYPDYKVLKITPDRRDVIISFTEKWRREREAEGIYLNTEFIAIKNALDMWNELPIEGLIICLHNRIVAYSIFSEQTPKMATIHFEKFDPDKKGSGQIVNWETAKHLSQRYAWINREQDIGLPGLRQAKLSYMPDYLIKFFSAKAKSQEK
ncbi:MAG: phosphatidylglycerol lysyltransferase domain-containing protein [Candidatus Cloacimonadaceae bacterium]|nr:phosphatidylglycerol lysyltransferase domain-containing protein [Candidatus Cloacimonadaceae bacterium]